MKTKPAMFLQGIIIILGVAAAVLLFWFPQNEGRNIGATMHEIYFTDPFLVYVYIASLPFFFALYQAFKILRFVRKGETISDKTVRALRNIKYCALSIICFVIGAEIILFLQPSDDRAGGVAMGAMVAFGALVAFALAETLKGVIEKIK